MNTSNGSAYSGDEIANELKDADKGIKRAMRLREVAEDTLKDMVTCNEFKPSHALKSIIFPSLFTLEATGHISFPHDDVFEWIEFKQTLGKLTELIDDIFEFKKSPGRPTEGSTEGIKYLKLFLETGRQLGKPINSEEIYWILLREATVLRLARCDEWSTRRASYEREAVYSRELKAAKTSIDRLWHNSLEDKPPRLDESDRADLKIEVLRHLANRK